MKEYLELCLQGPSTIEIRKEMLSKKRKSLEDTIQQLEESIDYKYLKLT